MLSDDVIKSVEHSSKLCIPYSGNHLFSVGNYTDTVITTACSIVKSILHKASVCYIIGKDGYMHIVTRDGDNVSVALFYASEMKSRTVYNQHYATISLVQMLLANEDGHTIVYTIL